MSTDAASVLSAVNALAPELSERSAEIEAARQLPADLVAKLKAAGCFRMFVPRSHGGLEIDLPSGIEVIEAVSAANGAAGWLVMIWSESPNLFALLPRRRFDEIYSRAPDQLMSGGFAPRGEARVVDGGYVVNGRWNFASGCQHANWIIGNSVVIENGSPRAGLMPGQPEVRAMLFRREQVEILDTWFVSGLRGTGSHDIAVKDARVASDDSFDIFFGAPCIPGPLYLAHLSQFVLHMGAVAVGIAQRALDDLVALAMTNKRRLYTQNSLADSPVFQHRLGEAQATVGGARATLHGEAAKLWRAMVNAAPMAFPEIARINASVSWLVQNAVAAVDSCYTAGGGTSLYDSSPLQRHLRDIHTLSQHAALNEAWLTRAGTAMLGRQTGFSY